MNDYSPPSMSGRRHFCYAVDDGAQCRFVLGYAVLLCPKHWRRVPLDLRRFVSRAWLDLEAQDDDDRDEAGELYAVYFKARREAIAAASR